MTDNKNEQTPRPDLFEPTGMYDVLEDTDLMSLIQRVNMRLDSRRRWRIVGPVIVHGDGPDIRYYQTILRDPV